MTTYTTWYVHGETSTEELSTNEDLDDNDSDFGDDMVGLVNRVYGVDDDVPIDNDADFDGIDTIFNQNPRNYDGTDENGCESELSIFRKAGRPLGKGDFKLLADDWKHKAHLYILNNCEEVWPYAEKYKNSLPNMSTRELRKRYNAEFPTWFRDHVQEINENDIVPKDVLNLAFGPYPHYKSYSAHIVNGYRFHTVNRQINRKSQNAGVLSRGDDSSSDKEYYGRLMDVLEIQYPGMNSVYIFNCEWFDVSRKGNGYTVDAFSITSVKANGRLNTDEPFILASQAEQVFYVEDPKKPNWLVVVKNQPRDSYKLPFKSQDVISEENCDDDVFQEEEIATDFRATRPLDDEDIDNEVVIGFEEIPISIVNQEGESIPTNIDDHNDANDEEYNHNETDGEIDDDEDDDD
ncbi:hypothetical protein M5689_010791 [Euphorbia peplus]|nr:hypothetical protein M5689_010791 [Euphorbia peplus]